MSFVTADKTMHIQLLKIQELRRTLQLKDNIIKELKCKIESDITSQIYQTTYNQLKIDELTHAMQLKDDVIKELIYKIDNIKNSLELLEQLYQYEFTNTREPTASFVVEE